MAILPNNAGKNMFNESLITKHEGWFETDGVYRNCDWGEVEIKGQSLSGYYWNSETGTAVETPHESYRRYRPIAVTPGESYKVHIYQPAGKNFFPVLFVDDDYLIISHYGNHSKTTVDLVVDVPEGATKMLLTTNVGRLAHVYRSGEMAMVVTGGGLDLFGKNYYDPFIKFDTPTTITISGDGVWSSTKYDEVIPIAVLFKVKDESNKSYNVYPSGTIPISSIEHPDVNPDDSDFSHFSVTVENATLVQMMYLKPDEDTILFLKNVQIEIGDEETDYEPYREKMEERRDPMFLTISDAVNVGAEKYIETLDSETKESISYNGGNFDIAVGLNSLIKLIGEVDIQDDAVMEALDEKYGVHPFTDADAIAKLIGVMIEMHNKLQE